MRLEGRPSRSRVHGVKCTLQTERLGDAAKFFPFSACGECVGCVVVENRSVQLRNVAVRALRRTNTQ